MKPAFLALFISASLCSFGQIKERFFYLDLNWQATNDESDAVALLRVRQISDTDFEWTYYNIGGPRIKQEHFRDIGARILNGKCTYYRANGTVDSSGAYINNMQNGTWSFWDDSCRIKRKKEFDTGRLVKDTLLPDYRDHRGKVQNPGEMESEYPGGSKAWTNYLLKNTHYPQRAWDRLITGEVKARFSIDQEGKILDAEIAKSVEYSLDEEVLRLILNSGRWQPASKDGKNVKSYKMLPIKFRIGGAN
jgi:protein TonB